MKLAISKCTTMHFMSDTAPITLHTDASDYGYLFQTVDRKDQPVAFVSRTLNKSQLRWSVIQKEAYGIFYSCMYLQSPLRDRFFTVRILLSLNKRSKFRKAKEENQFCYRNPLITSVNRTRDHDFKRFYRLDRLIFHKILF